MYKTKVFFFFSPKFSRQRNKFSFSLQAHPQFCLRLFARNRLIKNIFEEEKKFDSGTRFFWKIVPSSVYFDQGEDFKLTTELSEKVQYSRNQAIKNSLHETINEALLSR